MKPIKAHSEQSGAAKPTGPAKESRMAGLPRKIMWKRIVLLIFIVSTISIFCRDNCIENYTLFNPVNFLSNFISYDSDWDVRDSHNRAIVSRDEKNALRQLFIANVASMINKEAYSIARAMEILKVQFGLLKAFLYNSVYFIVTEIIVAIVNKITQLAAPFLFLILLITVKASFLPQLAYLFYSPKTKVAPLVLRC